MKHLRFAAFAALGVFAWGTAGPVRAQYPYSRPPLSEYMNLGRPGSAAFKYYGLVKPAQEYSKTIGQLQQGVADNQQNIQSLSRGGGGAGTLPETGHRIGFITNYQQYFLNMSPGGRGIQVAPGVGSNQIPGQSSASQQYGSGPLSNPFLPGAARHSPFTPAPGFRR